MGGNGKYKSNIQSSIPFLEDISILQELVDNQTMRTEAEVLKDFKKLKYKIKQNDDKYLILHSDKFDNILGDNYEEED